MTTSRHPDPFDPKSPSNKNQNWLIISLIIFSLLIIVVGVVLFWSDFSRQHSTNTPEASFSSSIGPVTTQVPDSTNLPSSSVKSSNTITVSNSSANGVIHIYSSLAWCDEKGEALRNAILMAYEEFTNLDLKTNIRSIGNYVIEYKPQNNCDSTQGAWNPFKEQTNAWNAIVDPETMVYIAPFNSDAAQFSLPYLNSPATFTTTLTTRNSDPIVTIAPINTLIGLTKVLSDVTEPTEPGKYYPSSLRNYFRLSPHDGLQAQVAVSFLQELQLKNILIIDDGRAYGEGLAKAVKKYCKMKCTTETLEINTTINPPITQQDFDLKLNNLLKRVTIEKFDAIYYAGTPESPAATIIKQLRDMQYAGYILSGNSLVSQRYIDRIGSAAQNIYATIGYPLNPTAAANSFIEKYKNRFGNPHPYAIFGYEAMSLALRAIKDAPIKDRKNILQEVEKYKNKDFTGVLGTWRFDNDNDITLKEYAIYEVIFNQMQMKNVWESVGSRTAP